MEHRRVEITGRRLWRGKGDRRSGGRRAPLRGQTLLRLSLWYISVTHTRLSPPRQWRRKKKKKKPRTQENQDSHRNPRQSSLTPPHCTSFERKYRRFVKIFVKNGTFKSIDVITGSKTLIESAFYNKVKTPSFVAFFLYQKR